MSLIFLPVSIGFMSHVDFKKWPCRLLILRVKGPLGDCCCSYHRQVVNPGSDLIDDLLTPLMVPW